MRNPEIHTSTGCPWGPKKGNAMSHTAPTLNVKRQDRHGDWRFLMRKALVPVVVAILLGALIAAPVAAKRSIHFSSTDTGASISSTLSVFKDHDSLFGSGAGVLTLTSATSDRGILYYGNATRDVPR